MIMSTYPLTGQEIIRLYTETMDEVMPYATSRYPDIPQQGGLIPAVLPYPTDPRTPFKRSQTAHG